jgi:polysaccharide biosynthesis transport protein
MNNEMQLAHAAGLSTGYDLSTAHHLSNAANNRPTGLKRLHRLLRGRYPLVITLGLLFGVAGGIVGYLSKKPQYVTPSVLMIDPKIPQLNDPNGEPMADYGMFIQSQVSVITNSEVIARALDEPEWKEAMRADGGARVDEASIHNFASSLDVDNPVGTETIEIKYSDPDPKVSLAGAQAIYKAYRETYEETDPLMFAPKLKVQEAELTSLASDLDALHGQLAMLVQHYNTDDLTAYLQTEMQNLAQWDNLLNNANTEISISEETLGGDDRNAAPGTPRKPHTPITEIQIAQLDPMMQSLRTSRQTMTEELLALKSNLGDNNPRVANLQNQLDSINAQIAGMVNSYRDNNVDPRLATEGSIGGNLELLRARAKIYKAQYDAQSQKVAEINKWAQSLNSVKVQIAQKQTRYDNITAQHDQLESQRSLMAGTQMRMIGRPWLQSEPQDDRRKEMAAVGFIGGAMLPTLIIMLIGLLDGRFRFSDETGSDLGGVPLLGILPNLPDLLTDPSQAATAAHCVHQIRTIMQIANQGEERRAFAVTSASPGDGKTSLTLALGLSFAASGSRTLLIDGDLIGGGLTARLNVTAEHGVLEAMAARDIMPFIRATDVSDLSFLPVGQAMGGYTGTISPASVRRLVNEARNKFDTILIDTGPILGSIEASPVSVAADGVVLCVSRGQQRQLVDRAIAHLHAIGAKLAGVVFNRAQATDFERSTNRLGLGSVPAANGNGRQRGEAIGPVARAVASSVRSSVPSQGNRS